METNEFLPVEAAFLSLMRQNFKPGAINLFLSACRRYFPECGEWSIVRELLNRLRQDAPLPPSQEGIAAHDRPFADLIASFNSPDAAPAVSRSWPIREVGNEFDFLARLCYPVDFTPIQAISLLLLRSIRPTKSAAVVAIMRDEGLGLLEWVAFHKAIGVSDIFIYANDNIDGSDELLELLAAAGVIRLIKNSIAPGTNPQRKAYQHALYLLPELRSFKWVLFLDADEFLVLDRQYDYRLDAFIRRLEQTRAEDLPGAVVFPWDWRLSDLKFRKTDGLLFERYPHSVPHTMVKSMTRLGATLGMCPTHIPTLQEGALFVDSTMAPIETRQIWGPELKSRAGGSVAHFWGKSFEEFAIKRRRSGPLDEDRQFSEYFEWTADLTDETFRPAPPVLLERTKQALRELENIPGAMAALEKVRLRFEELSRNIQLENNLEAIFDDLRATLQPTLNP